MDKVLNLMTGEIYKSPHFRQKGYGVYHVSPYMTGYGLGDTIRKFSQFLIPLFKSGSKAVGKQAIKLTSNVLQNLGDNEQQQSFKNILKSEKNRVIDKLGSSALNKIKQLTGGGRRRRKKTKKPTKPKARAKPKKKKKISH